MIIEEFDRIKFENGTEVPAYRGIIGLGTDGNVYGGYDSRIWRDSLDPDDPANITPGNRIELAHFMIKAWRQFLCRALNEQITNVANGDPDQ